MDGYLFDIEEYTRDDVRAIMQGRTCRQCANRIHQQQGFDNHVHVTVCKVRKSGLTKSGMLKVRANQPACILFTLKNDKR